MSEGRDNQHFDICVINAVNHSVAFVKSPRPCFFTIML